MARRLNTRFLTILLLVVVGAAVAVFLAEKFLIHEHPARYIALGEQAVKDRNWGEAVNNFGRAARLSPHDPQVLVMLGQALANIVDVDPDANQQEVSAYTQALEINPQYLPALKALSEWYTKHATLQPRSDLYRNAIDFSRRAYEADPTDEPMQARADQLVIEAWAIGLDTDQNEVNRATQEIKDLWKKFPANGDLPYAIARTEIVQGTNLADQAPSPIQSKEVTDHYQNAIAIFESVLSGPNGGSQAQNAAMHFYFARVLAQLSGLDQSSPDVMQKDQDRATAEMAKALAMVKEDDPHYQEINQTVADMAMRRGDAAAALKIYEKMPDSANVRLMRADVMCKTPAMQEQALQLLKSTLGSLTDDPNHIVLGGLRFGLMLEMTKVQIYRYLGMPDSPEKAKLHDEIRASLSQLDQVAGIRLILPLKDIEARFQIGSGTDEEMDAVQNLSKMLEDSPQMKKDQYWYDFETLLAQGYEDTNQMANAQAILKQVAQQFPHDAQTRKHLFRMLIVEQPDQARAYLTELGRLSPNDPDLNVFRIELLLSDPDKYHDKIKEIYALLGEKTARQISIKSRVAMSLKDFDEAIRLLKLNTAQMPNDVDDWVLLSRLLFHLGKKDQALAAANQGLAANPKDTRLRLLIPQIQGEDPKVIADLQQALAKENPDKVQGQLILAALAEHRGDLVQEEADLKAAEALALNSTRVQEMLFNHYLKIGKYKEAADCIAPLAKADTDHAGGELYRLALAEAQQDYASAETIARKLTLDKPEFARSWLALGNALEAEGQYDQAIPQFLVCLQKATDLAEAYVGLIKCYYALHRPDDALHAIEDGLKYLPHDQVLSQMKVAHEVHYSKPEDALKDIQAELDAHPDQPDLYAAMADVVVRYVDVLNKNNQPDDAVKQALQAVDVLKVRLAQWPNEGELYIALSNCQIAAKQMDNALKTLQTWANLPDWIKRPEPHLALCDFYEKSAMHDQAEEEMHDAMARSGYRPDLQVRMASLLALHQKYDDALTLLQEVNADNPDVREKRIQILLVEGKFDQAQDELKKTLTQKASDTEQLLSIWALALFDHGRYQEAADRATQALSISPKDLTPIFCRGRARLLMQPPDPAGAVKDLELIRQSDPNKVEVRIELGEAYLMLNQQADAISELAAGLGMDPKNKKLRMRLVSLYASGPHPRPAESLKLLQEVESVPPFDHDPDIFQGEAVYYNEMDDKDDALIKSDAALQLAPNDPAVVRTNLQLELDVQNFRAIIDHYAALSDKFKGYSWALWDVALAEKRLGDERALPDIRRALAAAETEDQPGVFYGIAKAFSQEFGYEQAVQDVSEMAKNNVTAKIALVQLYQAHGNDSTALATVDEIMSDFDKLSKRDQINVLSGAAVMYQLAKPTPLADKAYAAYQRWLKLEPDNLESLNNLACLLADDYSPPRAQEGLQYINAAISKMSRLGRTEPRLLDTQAWLLILNGSAAEGVHILNTAMSSFPTFPDEYLHVGEGYLRLETPDPVQAETQAKLGLQMINKRDANERDPVMRDKLQDLVNRSEAMKLGKPQSVVP